MCNGSIRHSLLLNTMPKGSVAMKQPQKDAMGNSAKTAVSIALLTTLMTVPALAAGDPALPQPAAAQEPFPALQVIRGFCQSKAMDGRM